MFRISLLAVLRAGLNGELYVASNLIILRLTKVDRKSTRAIRDYFAVLNRKRYLSIQYDIHPWANASHLKLLKCP